MKQVLHMVPMPRFLGGGRAAGLGYAFALCRTLFDEPIMTRSVRNGGAMSDPLAISKLLKFPFGRESEVSQCSCKTNFSRVDRCKYVCRYRFIRIAKPADVFRRNNCCQLIGLLAACESWGGDEGKNKNISKHGIAYNLARTSRHQKFASSPRLTGVAE